jgi:hypothetical protein
VESDSISVEYVRLIVVMVSGLIVMIWGMLLIENQSCVTSSCMELESYLRILSWSRYPPQFTEPQRKVLRDICGLCWLQAGDETQKITRFIHYRGKWNKR